MQDHTTNPFVRKTRKLSPRGLSASSSKTFVAGDCPAHDLGWQAIRRHDGLSRNYRDAGFGYLSTCVAGSGGGCNPCGAQRSERSLKEPAP